MKYQVEIRIYRYTNPIDPLERPDEIEVYKASKELDYEMEGITKLLTNVSREAEEKLEDDIDRLQAKCVHDFGDYEDEDSLNYACLNCGIYAPDPPEPQEPDYWENEKDFLVDHPSARHKPF